MASNLELLQIPPLYLSPEEVKDNRSSDQIVPRKIPDITSVLNRVSFTPAWTQPLMVTPLIRNSGSYLLPWNSSAPETAQCCPNYSIISAHQLICYRYALMSPDHLKRKVSSDIDPVILRAGILNSSSIRTTASNSVWECETQQDYSGTFGTHIRALSLSTTTAGRILPGELDIPWRLRPWLLIDGPRRSNVHLV